MIQHIEEILFAYQQHRSLQQYLDRRENEDTTKEYNSASSAGMCVLKNVYKQLKIETVSDPKNTRVVTLGSLVHKDFEDAVTWFKDNQAEVNDILMKHNIQPLASDNAMIMTEEVMVNDKLGTKCIVDYLEIIPEYNTAIIVDYKTAKAAAFSLQFTGRADWQKNSIANEKTDRQNGIYTGHELQLGTIGLSVLHTFGNLVDRVVLINAYYKKDDSMMRYKCINGDDPFEVTKGNLQNLAMSDIYVANEKLFHATKAYWKLVKDVASDENYSAGDVGAPMAGWECKWSTGECGYLDHCRKSNPSFFVNVK